MTSNCLIEPLPQYGQRIFATGPVGWAGVRHLEHRAFAPVVQAALALPGFRETAAEETITIGFARNTVLGLRNLQLGPTLPAFLTPNTLRVC